MLLLKYLLMWGGIGMIALAAGILAYDFYLEMKYRQGLASAGTGPLPPVPQVRWRTSLALALLSWGPIVLSLGIVVVPSGMAGVRVSQTSGTLPGALYPGAHFVVPLAESIVLFDTRDQLFTTGAIEDVGSAGSGKGTKSQPLNVQAKEGLTLGLSVTVRYRLDPKRLDYISEQHASAHREGNRPRSSGECVA
jgi:SPFH domain / Band 7 family